MNTEENTFEKDSIYRIFNALNKLKDYPTEMEKIAILVEGMATGVAIAGKEIKRKS